MNKPLRSTALAITLACVTLSTAAHARTVSYPHEAACVAPPATSSIYAGHREQIADTPPGPLAYYRFGHGSPLLLVTGYRATMSEWDATFLAELANIMTSSSSTTAGSGVRCPMRRASRSTTWQAIPPY